jgi:hypothetical protein
MSYCSDCAIRLEEIETLRAYLDELEAEANDLGARLGAALLERNKLAADAACEKAERESWQALANKYRAALEAFPMPFDGDFGGVAARMDITRWADTTREEALR